jgi:hypothetical protein
LGPTAGLRGRRRKGEIWLRHPFSGQVSDIVVSLVLFAGAFAVIIRPCATGILEISASILKNMDKKIYFSLKAANFRHIVVIESRVDVANKP